MQTLRSSKKNNADILRFTKLAGMVPLQYRKALFASAIFVEDVFKDEAIHEKFTEKENEPSPYSFWHYWSTYPHTDLSE